MTLVEVGRAQIALPRDVREAARLEEGDCLEAEILAVVDEERAAYAAERRR